MSANMVDKAHVDALVATALHGPEGRESGPDNAWHTLRWYDVNPRSVGWDQLESITRRVEFDNVESLGDELIAANLDSIHYRYPDTIDDPEATPGPIERYWEQPYSFPVRTRRLSAVAALKALNSYEYQSCEHPGWDGSSAERFCDSFRRALIHHLPGYREATWEHDDGMVR